MSGLIVLGVVVAIIVVILAFIGVLVLASEFNH